MILLKYSKSYDQFESPCKIMTNQTIIDE